MRIEISEGARARLPGFTARATAYDGPRGRTGCECGLAANPNAPQGPRARARADGGKGVSVRG